MSKGIRITLNRTPHRSTTDKPLFKIVALAQAGPKKGKPLMVVMNGEAQSSDPKEAGLFTAQEAHILAAKLVSHGDAVKVVPANEKVIIPSLDDPKEDQWQKCRIDLPTEIPKTPAAKLALQRKLIKEAERQFQHYEQYRGKYLDHQLVQILSSVSTKGGKHFNRGNITIAKLDKRTFDTSDTYFSVHCFTNPGDVLVETYKVKVL